LYSIRDVHKTGIREEEFSEVCMHSELRLITTSKCRLCLCSFNFASTEALVT